MSYKFIVLLSIITFCFSCNQNASKVKLFDFKVVPAKTLYNGGFFLSFLAKDQLRDIDFQLVEISGLKKDFIAYSKAKQVFKIDMDLGENVEFIYLPFTELTEVLNEIKLMSEKYNCKTIVYIHSDLIK